MNICTILFTSPLLSGAYPTKPSQSRALGISPCDESLCLTRLESPSMPLNQADDPDFLIHCSDLQLKIGEVNKLLLV